MTRYICYGCSVHITIICLLYPCVLSSNPGPFSWALNKEQEKGLLSDALVQAGHISLCCGKGETAN